MDLEKLQAIRDQAAIKAEERYRLQDTAFALHTILQSQQQVEASIKNSIQDLVKFLGEHQPKVLVTNQPAPPSMDTVVKAIEDVVAEAKKTNSIEQKEVDLSGVVDGLNRLNDLVSQLPKNYPTPKEVKLPTPKDYTGKFDEVTNAVAGIDVAPVVNVAPTEVNLDDIPQTLKDLLKAVDNIKFPAIPKTDFSSVENAVKSVQNSIDSLVFPVPNYILPFKDSVTGKATQATLNTDGSIQTRDVGLIPVQYDRITFTNEDGNANPQTGTVKKSGVTLGTLTMSYNASSKLTDIYWTGA